MKRDEKNTNKNFYQKWAREQLIKELCRLNQLLKDCLKIIKSNKTMREIKFLKSDKAYQPEYTKECKDCGWEISDEEYEEQRGVCYRCLYWSAH